VARVIVIGLTGGIGSGKSTVSSFMARLGAVVLSADEIGHDALKPRTEIWQEVVCAFGKEILEADGEIDRQKLGDIVFNDAEALARLNQIMHPRMHGIAEKRIEELKQQGAEVVVLEAPLLVEANWLDLVDQVWVTAATEATVVGRLRQRSGLSEAEALARINSQLSSEERIRYADEVIDTNGTFNEVEVRIRELWGKLCLEE
jgi:dephospho-CoA kinase